MKTYCLEQAIEKHGLILAVSVLVSKNFGGRVRLVSADAKRQADVAEVH